MVRRSRIAKFYYLYVVWFATFASEIGETERRQSTGDGAVAELRDVVGRRIDVASDLEDDGRRPIAPEARMRPREPRHRRQDRSRRRGGRSHPRQGRDRETVVFWNFRGAPEVAAHGPQSQDRR